MATPNPTDCRCDLAPTAKEDQIVESGVLGFVLEEQPGHLTIPELSLAMNRERDDDFVPSDAVDRAIRNLIGGGLLRLGGGLVLPTRAARYFAGLEVG